MEFAITRLAAWSPSRPTPEDWKGWAKANAAPDDESHCSMDVKKPKTEQVPPMVRRRLTLWGAMAVEVAFQCEDLLSENVPTLFASRHGDTHRTYNLLANIANQEPLSPTAFSLSVHNSSSGIFSITRKLLANAVALSASKETLGHAFVEANNLLSQGHSKVLIVSSDIPLADFYRPYADEVEQPHALAIVVEKPTNKSDTGLNISFAAKSANDKSEIPESVSSLSMPLQFLKAWYSEEAKFQYKGNRLQWSFKRTL